MRASASIRPAPLARWLGGGVLVLLACGADSEDGRSNRRGPDGADAAGSGSSGAAAGAGAARFDVCPTPIGSAEELALTPRADTNLELLALTLDAGHLTATQATYDRVVADIGAIRALAPSLSAVAFWPPHDGYTLRITFGGDATEALAAGTYTAWDCLLETYRARVGSVVDIFPTYAPDIYLDGIFDMPRMAELFGQLPDASAEINDTSGRRTLCVTRDGEHYEYVVDRTNGSCDPGATRQCTGSALHFATDAAGEPAVLETWTARDGVGAPEWFSRVCN